MSKDVKAVAAGLFACVVMAGLCVGLPWVVRHAEHPPPPYTQPLQYIGDDPPPSS
jgi:hypothetical protein